MNGETLDLEDLGELPLPQRIADGFQYPVAAAFYAIAVLEVAVRASPVRLSPTVVLYIILYIRHLQTSIKDSLLYILFLSNSVL